MLFRFSLYGFLKNQKYYEPFLILFFLEKGFSFFQIGLLIAFRELAVTLLEVPSGALADGIGRRITMICSMSGYILSFVVFSFSSSFLVLMGAMLLFAVGDAFRTGTHKAMIFKWLENQNRQGEKTRIYGFTRSWSKAGTALSSLIAAALVWRIGTFSSVFLFCIPPYLINLINLITYPGDLEGHAESGRSFRNASMVLKSTVIDVFRLKPLRDLVLETMGYEGVHKVTSDYVQPVMKAMVVSMPLLAGLEGDKGSAALSGGIYFLLALTGMAGSRLSHRLLWKAGEENRTVSILWVAGLTAYLLLVPTLLMSWYKLTVVLFLLLELLQNLWRPLQVGRFDGVSQGSRRATVLSVESQAKSFSAMIYAPAAGFLADTLGLWAVGAAGSLIALLVIIHRSRRR